jgi:hypothetical protein
MENKYKIALFAIFSVLFTFNANSQGMINNRVNIIFQSGSNLIISNNPTTFEQLIVSGTKTLNVNNTKINYNLSVNSIFSLNSNTITL